MTTEQPSDLVRSVSRALRILEEVGRHPQGACAKRIARCCGLHPSTTYHLLRTLHYEGYLEHLPNGDYAVGLKVADRFRDLAAALAGHPPVRAVLADLAATTGHSGYLARFVGGRVTITAVQESGGSPHVEDLVVGFHEAAHATALGKALLATLTPGDRRAYLAEQGMPRFTSRTITEPERLESQLVRRRHMYVEESQFRDEVSCIAALVATGQRDEPWWAVALSADSGRFRRTAGGLAGALRAAASSLSLQPA